MSSLRSTLLLLAGLLAACDGHTSVPPPNDPATPPPVASSPAAPSVSPAPNASPPPAVAEPASEYTDPPAPVPAIALHPGGKGAVRGKMGIVTSVEPHATHAGAEVLRHGGNAIDAAVAVAFALAVTHPSAGNIGGGGFMLVRLANGETHAIDFRETAPAVLTTEKMMANVENEGAIGYRSAGVPGSVAGLCYARDKFGTKPLSELVAPAIGLAKGHKLGPRQATVLSWQWPKLKTDPAARAIYGARGGKGPLKEGDMFRQPDLAKTLETIAKEGKQGFYTGPIAERIDQAMKAHGGYVALSDIAAYEAKERTPLAFSYRGFDVATMPPPSMGGIAFAQIMKTLERVRSYEAPAGSALSLHLFIEASRRAYAERRSVGADPDFMPEDTTHAAIARMLSAGYLATRTPPIDPDKATPSETLAASPDVTDRESPQTTHFSVVDAAGNAVSCTTTQSAAYGSKIVIPGTGILLGNALGGFSEKGVNAVQPGKRMASSMSPSIVTQDGKLALVLGSPGGDTIPNTVAQVFRNLVDYGMTIDEAVSAGRLHHQYLPDAVRVEKLKAPPKAVLEALKAKGHVLDLNATPIGDANNVLIDLATGTSWAYADKREGGRAEGVDDVVSGSGETRAAATR